MITIDYKEETSNVEEYLHYAQLISDAFTKALDQNECNVKLLIGFAEEIAQERDKFVDILQLAQDPTYTLSENPELSISQDSEPLLDFTKPLDSADELSYKNLAKKLKDACIECEFDFPTIDFGSNLDWSFDKLKLMLDLFKNIFKNTLNPNLCHVSSLFASSCIPSIISLIMMLVAAYAAILALKKLGGISLDAFISGIISGLLGQILASLSLRLNTSNTGVGCLIAALREIANEILSQNDQVLNAIPTEVLEKLGYKPPSEDNSYVKLSDDGHATILSELDAVSGKDSIETLIHSLENTTEQPSWTMDSFLETYSQMSNKSKDIVDSYMEKVSSEMQSVNESISNAFKHVSDVVESVVGSVNDELNAMFGLLDYFQCEAARSGVDFSSIMEYVNKLTTVINLLSAVLSVIAKKQVKKLCKTKKSVAELSTAIAEGGLGDDTVLSELEQAEIIEEFLGKVVELTEDNEGNLTPLIYDKDTEQSLPKLTMLSCNLKDFIEAHSLENVIDTVLKEIEQEDREALDGSVNGDTKDPVKAVRPRDEFVSNRRKWETYPIQYTVPKYAVTRGSDLTSDIIANDKDGFKGVNAGIQSIVELIYNNPLDKSNISSDISDSTPTDTDTSITNKDYRAHIKAPLSVDKSQKKAFENKCRDISDVLDILGSLTKK